MAKENTLSQEDKRTHLAFIQGVILRMSAASSNTKSWLIPVVAGAYAYALTTKSIEVAILGFISVICFAFLDANYLSSEQKYVKLYELVANGDSRVPPFSLDVSVVNEAKTAKSAKKSKNIQHKKSWLPSKTAVLSWSIAPFYGMLLITGLCISGYLTAINLAFC
ncbi:hypothetical protein M2118_001176 [Aurantimicrobium minutum]|uniref:hypothetical protein n=1 Tax=Aurantimicrobium minutum TaxID=708131 RepID=UPI0024763B23|nr:hypothetical protein [Aurantimicrobium minutum]MDH6278203.1 hypothetical protein [Aurantimicrobium minutum]